jgi:hypothetical protein
VSKFKVGDLITDKKTLVQIIDVKETHYTIKYIGGYYHGKITNTQKGLERFNSDWVDNLCVKYDLDNPLTKKVFNGKCYCNQCAAELHYGDECIRYGGDIYCDEDCLMAYVRTCSENSVIEKNDLDDSSTTERPLFDLSEEQIEEIKKVRKLI